RAIRTESVRNASGEARCRDQGPCARMPSSPREELLLRGGLDLAALGLAVVDAGTHHLVRGLFLRLVLRKRRARHEQRGDGGGKHGILHRHGVLPRKWTSNPEYGGARNPLHGSGANSRK